jgi:methionyl aminopeptidase
VNLVHASIRANDECWCGSGRKYKRCHRARLVRPGTVGPWRDVPAQITRPDYVGSGMPVKSTESMVKSLDVIARLRVACRIARDVLREIEPAVAPGVTTDEIDRVAHEAHVRRDAYPSPLGYKGFPKSVCTSVNEVICHGIPDDRPLVDGDIVNVDVTVYVDGVHGDTSATFLVGRVDPVSRHLVRTTRECLDLAVDAVAPGEPLNVIGRAIETHAHAEGLNVVRSFVGHGIGEVFHGPPQVPHYFEPTATTIMEPGMVFTIEPMITIGDIRPIIWDDGWTAVTADGSRTAQFEHTVLVTDTGVDVLTR